MNPECDSKTRTFLARISSLDGPEIAKGLLGLPDVGARGRFSPDNPSQIWDTRPHSEVAANGLEEPHIHIRLYDWHLCPEGAPVETGQHFHFWTAREHS